LKRSWLTDGTDYVYEGHGDIDTIIEEEKEPKVGIHVLVVRPWTDRPFSGSLLPTVSGD
jgi:hypothetical protein